MLEAKSLRGEWNVGSRSLKRGPDLTGQVEVRLWPPCSSYLTCRPAPWRQPATLRPMTPSPMTPRPIGNQRLMIVNRLALCSALLT